MFLRRESCEPCHSVPFSFRSPLGPFFEPAGCRVYIRSVGFARFAWLDQTVTAANKPRDFLWFHLNRHYGSRCFLPVFFFFSFCLHKRNQRNGDSSLDSCDITNRWTIFSPLQTDYQKIPLFFEKRVDCWLTMTHTELDDLYHPFNKKNVASSRRNTLHQLFSFYFILYSIYICFVTPSLSVYRSPCR